VRYDEFSKELNGFMGKDRLEAVHAAFSKFPNSENNSINFEDIKNRFDASFDPQVRAGKRRPEDLKKKNSSHYGIM